MTPSRLVAVHTRNVGDILAALNRSVDVANITKAGVNHRIGTLDPWHLLGLSDRDPFDTFLAILHASDVIDLVPNLGADLSTQGIRRMAVIVVSDDPTGAGEMSAFKPFRDREDVWVTDRMLTSLLDDGSLARVAGRFLGGESLREAALSELPSAELLAALLPQVVMKWRNHKAGIAKDLEAATKHIENLRACFPAGIPEYPFEGAWVTPRLHVYVVDQLSPTRNYRRDVAGKDGLRCLSVIPIPASQLSGLPSGILEDDEVLANEALDIVRGFEDARRLHEGVSIDPDRSVVLWHLSDLPLPRNFEPRRLPPILVFSGWKEGIGDAHLLNRSPTIETLAEDDDNNVVGIYESLHTGLDCVAGIPSDAIPEGTVVRFRRALNAFARRTALAAQPVLNIREDLVEEGVRIRRTLGRHEESGALGYAIMALELRRFSDAGQRLLEVSNDLRRLQDFHSAEKYETFAQECNDTKSSQLKEKLKSALESLSKGGSGLHGR